MFCVEHKHVCNDFKADWRFESARWLVGFGALCSAGKLGHMLRFFFR